MLPICANEAIFVTQRENILFKLVNYGCSWQDACSRY